jgi:hypothetical protein
MPKWLRKLFGREKPDPPGVVLGYAFNFINEDLGLEHVGFPLEILGTLEDMSLDADEVASHPKTDIKGTKMWQEEPVLEGEGPHAGSVLKLQVYVELKDFEQAEAVLREDPETLTGDHEAAYIPLVAFASSGWEEQVRFLLDHGAPPNREGQLGMTPLHWAAARGHEKVVDMLLEAGADPKALNWSLLTPAEVAGLNGHSRLARKLREKAGRPHEVDPLKITLKRMGITGT